jgi:hypothetical protein
MLRGRAAVRDSDSERSSRAFWDTGSPAVNEPIADSGAHGRGAGRPVACSALAGVAAPGAGT